MSASITPLAVLTPSAGTTSTSSEARWGALTVKSMGTRRPAAVRIASLPEPTMLTASSGRSRSTWTRAAFAPRRTSMSVTRPESQQPGSARTPTFMSQMLCQLSQSRLLGGLASPASPIRNDDGDAMNAVIGTLPAHYERLGLIPNVIQSWEDGMRTAAADGTFEWWYFDAHLDDGSTVTVEFHTKPPYVSPRSPLTPFVLVTLTDRDGMRTDWQHTADPAEFLASPHGCDVTIGRNTF